MKTDQETIDFIYAPVQAQLAQVEDRFADLASRSDALLQELLAHITKIPGKRVRPAITLLCAGLLPYKEDVNDIVVTMGAAVELLHMASLVHDDMVDNASVRRGQATVSSVWGDNVAVMLGDYIFAASAVFVCDTKNVRVIRRFSETIMELSTGQIMESFGAFKWDRAIDEYKDRIYNKTASLFRTAAESGAILGGAPESQVQLLTQYGRSLGMAFQIVDDVLDFEGTEEEIGKPVGHDLLEGTLTLPSMLLVQRYPDDNPVIKMFRGDDPETNRLAALDMIRNSTVLEESLRVAEEYCDDARSVLGQLADTRERQSLMELVSYVTDRRR